MRLVFREKEEEREERRETKKGSRKKRVKERRSEGRGRGKKRNERAKDRERDSARGWREKSGRRSRYTFGMQGAARAAPGPFYKAACEIKNL